jgi:hypothetical protein
MGKDLPGKPALLEDPANGTLVEVVKAADAAAVLKTKAPSSNPRADTFSAQQRAREAKQRAARELRMQIYLATRDKVAKAGLGLEDVRLVAAEYWERLWHDSKAVIAPWWIPESQDAKGKKVQRQELITKRIATMSGEDLVRLVLDCAAAHLVRNVDGHEATKDGMAIEALAKRHKVDVTAMKRTAVKEAEAKAQAKKAKAKKAKARPRARRNDERRRYTRGAHGLYRSHARRQVHRHNAGSDRPRGQHGKDRGALDPAWRCGALHHGRCRSHRIRHDATARADGAIPRARAR